MAALLEFFWIFLQIGLFSIGGGYAVLPLIQDYVVESKGWLDFRQFTDVITISQMTPGPIAVNASTFVGLQVAGVLGAIAATAGCVISGAVIALVLYQLFEKYRKLNMVSDILSGLRAVSTGLIASAAGTILLIAVCGVSDLAEAGESVNWVAIVVCLMGLLLLRKWKWNPMTVLLLSGFVGFLAYYLLPEIGNSCI
jgi:chromate transporter